MTRPRSTTLALLMTLAGCPSDAPVDDNGDGTTGSSTGSVVTTADGTGPTPGTAGSSSSEGSDSTGPESADAGSSESTADSGSTDSGSTSSGSTDSGSTDSGSTDSGSTDSGSTGSGSSGSDSSSSDSGSGSSSEGSTTGDDDIGFQQCDSPDDCLPGEGCLNDDVDNPTVAVCFLEGCVTDDDCPGVPAGGDSDAFCVDVTGDGVDDCVIVCSSTVCPTGMECFLNSICAWPLD